jgi:glutamate racemase
MIGIFDSGVGGLTVVKEVFKQLPEYQIIYFGDTARLPYGTKGEAFVKRYSKKITQWLIDKGADVIVIACNTSSAWAADYLKKEFPNVPIFEMINPAVKEAKDKSKSGRVGVIGTPGTIKSNVYLKKLKGYTVFSKACPLFVPLVEEGWINDEIAIKVANKYLYNLKQKKIDTLVLGCTHYPLLQNTIKKIMGDKVKIINPASAIISNLRNYLKNNPGIIKKVKKNPTHNFYFSDQPYNFEKISHICFKKELKIKINDPF